MGNCNACDNTLKYVSCLPRRVPSERLLHDQAPAPGWINLEPKRWLLSFVAIFFFFEKRVSLNKRLSHGTFQEIGISLSRQQMLMKKTHFVRILEFMPCGYFGNRTRGF